MFIIFIIDKMGQKIFVAKWKKKYKKVLNGIITQKFK